ncbi:unnamed protein product [[Candida] boidinii]|nr:unnamed protein product [[Candida] boidinii]
MSVNSGIERYIKSVDINFDNIMKESQTESKSPIDNSDDTNDNDANTKIDPSIPQNSVIQNITEKLKDLSLEIKESDSNQRTSTSTNIEPALDSNDNNESKKDMTNLNVDLTTTANNNNINSTNNNINNTNNFQIIR